MKKINGKKEIEQQQKQVWDLTKFQARALNQQHNREIGQQQHQVGDPRGLNQIEYLWLGTLQIFVHQEFDVGESLPKIHIVI